MAAASREYIAMFSIGAKLLGSFKGAMSAAQSRLRKLELSARSVARGITMMGAALAGLAIGAGITAAGLILRKILTGAEEAYKEQLLINTQLTSVFAANAHIQKLGAGTAEKQVELLGAQAGELQKVGVVSDEALLAGAKQLAIYDLSPKKISQMMPILGNVLAATKGVTATQQDSQKLALMIGKGISGQLMGIKKIAPALGAFTSKQWKALSAEQRRVKITEALVKAYGNANEELGKTDIGRITRAQHAFGELQERVGKIKSALKVGFADFLIKLLPRLEPIVERIGATLGRMFDPKKAGNFGDVIADKVVAGLTKLADILDWVATNGDTLWPIVKKLAAAFIALQAAALLVNVAMAANPFGILIAGLVGLGFVVKEVADNWDTYSYAIQQAWDYMKNMPIIGPVLQDLERDVQGIIAAWSAMDWSTWSYAWEQLKTDWNEAVDWIKTVWTNFTTWLTTPIDFSAIWESLKNAFSNAIADLKAQWNAFASSLSLPSFLQFGGVPRAAAAKTATPPAGLAPGMAGIPQQFGGIHMRPTLATLAERGPEAVIPLTGGRRAEGLLDFASRAIGMGSTRAGPTALSFAPVVTINGNATETEQRAMDSRLRDLASDFINQFKAAQQQERRLSYEGGYG